MAQRHHIAEEDMMAQHKAMSRMEAKAELLAI